MRLCKPSVCGVLFVCVCVWSGVCTSCVWGGGGVHAVFVCVCVCGVYVCSVCVCCVCVLGVVQAVWCVRVCGVCNPIVCGVLCVCVCLCVQAVCVWCVVCVCVLCMCLIEVNTKGIGVGRDCQSHTLQIKRKD